MLLAGLIITRSLFTWSSGFNYCDNLLFIITNTKLMLLIIATLVIHIHIIDSVEFKQRRRPICVQRYRWYSRYKILSDVNYYIRILMNKHEVSFRIFIKTNLEKIKLYVVRYPSWLKTTCSLFRYLCPLRLISSQSRRVMRSLSTKPSYCFSSFSALGTPKG